MHADSLGKHTPGAIEALSLQNGILAAEDLQATGVRSRREEGERVHEDKEVREIQDVQKKQMKRERKGNTKSERERKRNGKS